MKKRCRSQAGFTLIEVIIVILLLGIAAALVVPRGLATAANHAALDSQAQQMAGMARLAREKAMAEGVEYRLVIEAKKCSLEADDGTEAAQFNIDERVSIVPRPPLTRTIIFDSKGLPQYGGGTIKVETKGEDPELKNVIINEQGFVEIK